MKRKVGPGYIIISVCIKKRDLETVDRYLKKLDVGRRSRSIFLTNLAHWFIAYQEYGKTTKRGKGRDFWCPCCQLESEEKMVTKR